MNGRLRRARRVSAAAAGTEAAQDFSWIRWHERVNWLRQLGSERWRGRPAGRGRVQSSARRGSVFDLGHAGQPLQARDLERDQPAVPGGVMRAFFKKRHHVQGKRGALLHPGRGPHRGVEQRGRRRTVVRRWARAVTGSTRASSNYVYKA